MHSNHKAQSIARNRKFIQRNYFFPRHNPLRYLRYRLFRPFLKLYTKQLLRKWKDAPIPWMTPAAIDILDAVLTPDMKGFEFGSGRSTLFIAPRVGELVSLEHDEKWFGHIRDELKKGNLSHVQYFHQPARPDAGKASGYPKNNYESYVMEPVAATCYTAYYTFIDRYPNDTFDFIIIDGRARTECALHSLPKLKKGGMLILDNSERNRYKAVHEMLAGWKKVFTTSGLSDTTFWFKP